jgi:hypothetical protein
MVQIKTTGMMQLVEEIKPFNKYSSTEKLDNAMVSEISEKVTFEQGEIPDQISVLNALQELWYFWTCKIIFW